MLNKEWIKSDNRVSIEYREGIDAFIGFVSRQGGDNERIRCPCNKCRNTAFKSTTEVRLHLLRNGFNKNYMTWILHGEKLNASTKASNFNCDENLNEEVQMDDVDDLIGLVHDAYAFENVNTSQTHEEMFGETPNDEASKFYKLLKDATVELYPSSKVSKLSFIVKFLNLKTLHNLTCNAADAVLDFCKEILPSNALVPNSYYEARAIIRDLCLDYEKIDACKNDCVLFWEEHKDAQCCPICGLSRWKVVNRKRKIPHKILRYFPLKGRLQKLYMSKKTAKDMRWHEHGRVDDGILRHPADSIAWKSFDEQHKSFSEDPRNVRLGLASDGFNPYGNMSTSYSIWPVVLVPYNLPPWLCMKQPYFMMTLLIPGRKCPENDIDVYLQPLIKELLELWEVGVHTYDAYAQQNFQLRAAVMWTINDFPAYGNLSGWVTKGKLACPCCHKDTSYLSIRSKLCYMGHRRFLPIDHPWRRNMASFNGEIEDRIAPQMLTGDGVLDQLRFFKGVIFGKGQKRKRTVCDNVYNWKKKSIFFQLPYWKTLQLRHNLDVMHIERNVSDNVLGTLMNMAGKTKDTIKSRYDLVDMGIRETLHPLVEGNKIILPAACYVLPPSAKIKFCNFLANLRVPDGFSSNISRCVNVGEKKIHGLKCHDHHVFFQRILPLSIRGLLPKEVCGPLTELSNFFKNLCSKSLRLEDLDQLEEHIPRTLCKLETIFPPAFFDVMIHLPIHLAKEAKIAGPVHYRWMYPIERYLRTLKKYVRNKARPEGSIAEGYILDECSTFCARYLNSVETKFNKAPRNDDGGISNHGLSIFGKFGRPKGAYILYELSFEEYDQARMYVLQNCDEVWPFIEEHKTEFSMLSRRNALERHYKEFHTWFYHRVSKLHADGHATDELLSLATGPLRTTHRYSTFITNGFRFHTKDRATERTSQNSGVLVKGDDSSPEKEYYGILKDVFELSYVGGRKVFLFRCHWWDVGRLGRGYKIDKYGYTSVNVNGSLNSSEPFVLAFQAEQVFYIEDNVDNEWLVVVKTTPRDLYSMPPVKEGNSTDFENSSEEEEEEEDAYQQQDFEQNMYPMEHENMMPILSRDDVEPETFNVNIDFDGSEEFIDDNVDNELDDDHFEIEFDD
ncbi:uncharacterized protein LOC120007624 isoform X1 [Tripterygium wilfordii]|uniref:uncharacterized protein LOC120007624 isoform X1 n=3 Tax=Tripterygium wilfordii TaxID=458696 RepID=UPI0018F844FF|nr:uncharacterized protein LOC120007624 isoform X1 [Tripterygium wilfordii]